MNGFVNVLKPTGMSSHDVVNRIRHLFGIKKVGHTGTLDPGAAGVLLICCGKATRLIEYLEHDKEYRAEITFGTVSSTGDAFGELKEKEIPGNFSEELLKAIIPCFIGEISQIPPMTSAVRHGGKKLYELARAGRVVERQARTVKIHKLEVVKWFQGPEKPRALLDITCSAGTYIRTLCQDIGEKAGCGAYMSFLLRTGVGSYPVAGSHTLEELEGLSESGRLAQCLITIEEALSFFPVVEMKEGSLKSICSGAALYPPGIKSVPENIGERDMVVLNHDGKYVAVAMAVADERERIFFKPVKVIL
ncbi:MAG: tRNA pseudouridine(55) synthase TruB [Bacillota bacterium]